MTKINFEYIDKSGMTVVFNYENQDGKSGRLQASFSSPKVTTDDELRKVFSMYFNAIGESDPLAFLESLDESYLNDKIGGISVSQPDLFKTIEQVRKQAYAPEYELTAADLRKVEEIIDTAAQEFWTDHSLACQMLIYNLSMSEMACFQDDVGHLIVNRKTDDNVLFHKEIWPDFLSSLDDYFTLNIEFQDQLDALHSGNKVSSPDGPEV